MFRRSRVIGLAAVLAVGSALLSPVGGGSTALAQTQPAHLEKRGRPTVPVSERIAMGVEEPTWIKEHGKVHPDVRRALAYQKELDRKLDQDFLRVMLNHPGLFTSFMSVFANQVRSSSAGPLWPAWCRSAA